MPEEPEEPEEPEMFEESEEPEVFEASEEPEEPDRGIWRNLADATKSEEELPKAEDFVEGPLPETLEEIEERERKLEAAKRAEEAKRIEEERRLEEIRREEEARRRFEDQARRIAEEEARKRAEAVRWAEEARIAEEARKAEEARRAEEVGRAEEARRAEEAGRAEEARRAEKARIAEEIRRKEEEARIALAQAQRAAEEAKKAAEAKMIKEIKKAEPSYAPESENLLLKGLINLLQPALDIKMEQKRYQRWIKGWDKAIEMHIVGEGYTYVLIKDGKMSAALGKAPKEPEIVLEGEYETITNYLNGELDPILMFFDFVLLRKVRLVKGLEIKLTSFFDGSLFRQARVLYKIDKILRIR